MQTLEGHAQNISCVGFHPELPIILTGSEDGGYMYMYENPLRHSLYVALQSNLIQTNVIPLNSSFRRHKSGLGFMRRNQYGRI